MNKAFRIFVSGPSIRVCLSVSEHPISKMAPRQRAIHVSLRNVALVIPEGERERGQLEQDLSNMGCNGLLDRPWALKSKKMVSEFDSIRERLVERPNIFNNTMWDRPEE